VKPCLQPWRVTPKASAKVMQSKFFAGLFVGLGPRSMIRRFGRYRK
jgi:hypothetical protein